MSFEITPKKESLRLRDGLKDVESLGPIEEVLTRVPSPIARKPEKDRNYHLGGRSFYFFDFDDNIAFLGTLVYLFHKETKAQIAISSAEYAIHQGRIGHEGEYKDFDVDFDDKVGTFRNFRDKNEEELRKLQTQDQVFIEDVAEALGNHHFRWMGPSWNCFYHATFNQRPVSLITARGHHPQTIRRGIQVFVQNKKLPQEPNYLSIFPVSHRETRLFLGDTGLQESSSQLKRRAIRASVEKAILDYGYSDHHRFGMSDDDPKNIEMIFQEMHLLKKDYPEMSFFLIETAKGGFLKHEILP